MIARHSSLPFLQLGSHPVDDLTPEWLERCISRAMNGLPGDAELISEAVGAALVLHFSEDYNETKVSFKELRDATHKCLHSIGHDDIAKRLNLIPPAQNLSLTEFAFNTQSGFLIGFYSPLGERIRHLRNAGVQTLRCTGLEQCVHQLLGDAADLSCLGEASDLAHEILDFLNTAFLTDHDSPESARLIVR